MYKEAYLIISLFVLFTSCSEQKTAGDTADATTLAFQEMQALYHSDLNACIAALDSLQKSKTATEMQEHYHTARMYFKYAEPVLSFTDQENFRYLNQPNILKVEEEDFTDIKIKEPSGFQVLEELIWADSLNEQDVFRHAGLVSNRLKLIRQNSSLLSYKPYHFLWMLRNEINRVALTGITGFDSPVLENSLQENAWVYSRLKNYLTFFKQAFSDQELYRAWHEQLDKTLLDLTGEFASFNRYAFIKNHTHAQLALWVKTREDWNVIFPFTLAINHEATSLFSNNTFNLKYFDDLQSGETTEEKVLLGKKLFNDPSLSASGKVSCASCHQEALAFTDGKRKSDGQDRNSPTLSYAALQRGFFYDKRSGSLEGQIVSVVNSQTEFHSNLEAMTKAVMQQPDYQQAFTAIYGKEVSDAAIRNAIASYIRSLAPFNSKFDRNINGLEQSLTDSEIRGFNLFTGKAKCATCHFAPVFNGTVPPEFSETELELLGVPAANDTANAQIDPDPGRYNLYQTAARKYFFKTPTVRNSALTAPYMHNGVYNNLEEVMDFYNRGGGAGIGIALEHQTLPPDALLLNKQEIKDIIAFLNTLNDQQPATLKFASLQQD
ncbi:cytochrome c peroxidase [Cesiribacter sp. SM1]|uniref:cytochrome c peroxidase n=1 Tax=Cesiribacter sp. SM1 TaxID=2861196 RepID=UPI001CD3259D|nr:cytochrome c peroxidase [Cesiribacter sp. SM1]